MKTGGVQRREICNNNSKILKNLRSFFKKENNKKQEKQEKQVLQYIFFVFFFYDFLKNFPLLIFSKIKKKSQKLKKKLKKI